VFRYTYYVLHIEHQLSKIFDVKWFGKNFIHSTFDCSIDIFIFYMSSDGNYLRLTLLGYIHLVVKFSYLLRAVVTIHHWHVTVHENQTVLERVIVINWSLNLLESLFAIVGKFTYFRSILNSENHEEAVDDITIELFIITHQNLRKILRFHTQVLLHKVAVNPWCRNNFLKRMLRLNLHISNIFSYLFFSIQILWWKRDLWIAWFIWSNSLS
jgi:hypothetical protein